MDPASLLQQYKAGNGGKQALAALAVITDGSSGHRRRDSMPHSPCRTSPLSSSPGPALDARPAAPSSLLDGACCSPFPAAGQDHVPSSCSLLGPAGLAKGGQRPRQSTAWEASGPLWVLEGTRGWPRPRGVSRWPESQVHCCPSQRRYPVLRSKWPSNQTPQNECLKQCLYLYVLELTPKISHHKLKYLQRM